MFTMPFVLTWATIDEVLDPIATVLLVAIGVACLVILVRVLRSVSGRGGDRSTGGD